jgi:hypothetical protein
MTSRNVTTEWERDAAIKLLRARKLPYTLTLTDGRRRTVDQNRLQRLWMGEIAEQLGDQTPEEVRGYCKLAIGVPILRAENDAFREAYDKHIKGLPYETKMAMMMEPLDWPVTRLMTTAQKSRYLDGVQRRFAEQGVRLTQPEIAA